MIDQEGRILGSLVVRLTELLAHRDPRLWHYTDYLQATSVWSSIGKSFYFEPSALTSGVLKHIMEEGYSDDAWTEWPAFM
ncbi:hypothetical protein [Sorangium sp. So ce1099]|uniref:hypothetical protein n=1 Tax=Sorangium sp. So ce1099 TaxID=3133331 RepID=UPI003F5FE5A6